MTSPTFSGGAGARTRRVLLAAGALGGAGALGAACRPGGGAGGGGGEGSGQRISEPVTVQYWSIFGGPEGQRMTEIGQKYMQETPLVTIDAVHGAPEAPTKMVAASAAGNPPDVIGIRHIYAGPFAERNVLSDLTPRELQQAALRPEDFDPTVWRASEYKGRRYTIPFDVHGYMLLVNEPLVRELGADPARPPGTWSAWQEWTTRLTQNGRTGTYFDVSGESLVRTFYGFLRQAGGSFFSPDETNVTVNGAQGVEALELMTDVYQRAGLATVTEGPQPLFETRRLASWIAGSFQLNRLRGTGQLPFEDLRIVLYPQKNPAAPAWWAQSHQLGLPRAARPDEKRRGAAFHLVRWLTEHPMDWSLAGFLPANRKVLASDAFQKSADPVIANLKTWERYLASAAFLPPNPKYLEAPPAVAAALLRSLQRDLAVRPALAEVEQALTVMLRS
jgi:multiple sugar transport system substrate-binding protein